MLYVDFDKVKINFVANIGKMSKRKAAIFSGDEAVRQILDWVETGNEDSVIDGEDDLFDLNGDNEDNAVVDENIDEDAVDLQVNDDVNDFDDDDWRGEGPTRRVHRRRTLTYQRDVNSIDTALDESNYDPFEIPSDRRDICGYIPVKTDKKKKTEVHFANQTPRVTGRQRCSDVITNTPGLTSYSRNADTPEKAFSLFLTDRMIASICVHTNTRIKETVLEKMPEGADYPEIMETNIIEMKAFIGLMYYRGLYGMNMHRVNILFSERHGAPVFSACMSRNRFEFLQGHLCFDHAADRDERWKHDRFTAIREVFEGCNKKFGKALVPDDYLSLDETLYPTRVQISFKQYNPDKPAKYGLLFKSINGARYPYTHQTIVYSGKPVEEPNEYYVAGTIEYIKRLVDTLSKHQRLAGRNISMDRLYTSFEVADWLLQKKITMVGTIQANRVGIPAELKTVNNRGINSYELYWRDDGKCNISSYVVKTSKGKKNVMVVSTVEPVLGITKDDKKKPALYKLYDFTKGGTDIIDQKMGSYTTKAKSRKWTKVAFSYLLDTIRVNASTIYAMVNKTDPKKVNSFEFGCELADALVHPFISTRSLSGLSQSVRHKIELYLRQKQEREESNSFDYDYLSDQRKRCRMCMNEASGIDQKSKKDKLPKMRSTCQKCGETVCRDHTISFCKSCN